MEPLKYDKVESYRKPACDYCVIKWYKKNLISYNRKERSIKIGGFTLIRVLEVSGLELSVNPICEKCTIRYGQLIHKKKALFDKGYIYCPECDGDYGE